MAQSFLLTALALVVIIGLYFAARKRGETKRYVTYKVVLPAEGTKPGDLKRWLLVCRQLMKGKSFSSWRERPRVSLEAVFSGNDGLQLLFCAPIEISLQLKNHLYAYWPKLHIEKIRTGRSYSLKKNSGCKLSRWRTGSSFPAIEDGNIIETLAGSLRGLSPSEFAGWQINFEADQTQPILRLSTAALKLMYNLARSLFIAVADASLDRPSRSQRSFNRAVKLRAVNHKSRQFKVSLCSVVGAETEQRLKVLDTAVAAALKVHGLKPIYFNSEVRDFTAFSGRLMRRTFNADSAMLSRLFDLPSPGGSWQLDADVRFSSALPVALDRRQHKPDLVLGLNHANDESAAVGLSKSEREKHMLIIGGTGTGKSNLVAYAFSQDMHNGKGAALIDPHGELARDVLRYVPKDRIADCVYVDPADIRHPVAVNLLELPKGLRGDNLEAAKDFIAESVVSILRKTFSGDDSGGHRIEYILRNAVHTAFSVPDANLFTLHKLLTNDSFRNGIVSSLKDESLKDFWYGEFNKAGSFQRVKMIAGVTAKLGRYQRSVAARRMLEYPNSSINFDDVINSGKLLICNLDKGALGEDTSSLIGMIMLAKLQLASWRRLLRNSSKPRPFYLYVDEFEQFNAPVFTQLISDSRKYGLHLTLAEQTLAHQDKAGSDILLANVGNVVAFRIAADSDVRKLLPLYLPHLNPSDLINLDPYNFYLKSSGEKSRQPVSAQSILIKGKGSKTISDKIINSSHKHYSYPYIDSIHNTPLLRIPYKS